MIMQKNSTNKFSIWTLLQFSNHVRDFRCATNEIATWYRLHNLKNVKTLMDECYFQ